MTQPDHGELTDTLRKEAEDLFPGLDVQKVTLFAVGDGAQPAVWWTVRGTHGGSPATEASPGAPFLGFYATGREVTIDVVSMRVEATVGLDSEDANDENPGRRAGNEARVRFAGWRHSWDRLGALQQIGVRAVGRPVLR